MTGFATRLRRALSAARYRPVSQRVELPGEALPLAYWADKAPLRVELPVAMLRSQGGFTYGADHPFCRGLSGGEAALTQFYGGFQPAQIAALYAPSRARETGADLPAWELPWRARMVRKPPPGEKGLGAGHGLAFWGPCSPQKVALEHRRLTGTLASIQRRGYDPDRHGDIEGQLMTDGKRVAFMVLGGKHRAAVLAHLGHSHIPVRLRPGLMAVIDARAVADWPLVSNGTMSHALALAILDIYLDGRGMSDVLASAAISA